MRTTHPYWSRWFWINKHSQSSAAVKPLPVESSATSNTIPSRNTFGVDSESVARVYSNSRIPPILRPSRFGVMLSKMAPEPFCATIKR